MDKTIQRALSSFLIHPSPLILHHFYSYLSATIGSTFVARRAGT